MAQQMVEQAEPFLVGNFAPVHDERDDRDLPVTGTLPAALEGTYLRNGSNPAFPPMGRYHWFDGDGMLHGVHLEGGRARYANRYVKTLGLDLERAAGRNLFGGINNFTFPEAEHLGAMGGPFKNVANTSVMQHGDKILCLWEGGFPHEVTREMETVGIWDFCGELVGAMTAHPKVDPRTGEMLFFGYSQFAPFLRFHVADASGRLVSSQEIDLPAGVMIHDFVITDRHALFLDAPAVFDFETGAGLRWAPENGCRIGVLDRAAAPGTQPAWYEVEPCFVFHFMNAWADGDVVSIDAARHPRLSMPGDAGGGPVSLSRFTVDLTTGATSTTQLDDRGIEFPRVDDRRQGLRNRIGYAPSFSGDGQEFDSLLRYDMASGASEAHVYGTGRITGEAVFVADPDRDGEDEGWLLSFVYDRATDTSDLVVLDAGDITGTPVATVHLPVRVPFGFHGTWVPA